MIRHLLFLLLILSSKISYSQYWNLLESYQTDSIYSGRHITDADGNIYYAGYFSDVINIPGFSQFSNFGRAAILIKFNSCGYVQWTRKIANEKHTLPVALSIDLDNHITLIGSFHDTLQIGNFSLISRGGTDIFLTQFDQNGNYLWAKSYGTKHDDLNYSQYPPMRVDLITDIQSKEIFFTAVVGIGNTGIDTFYYENDSIVFGRKSQSILAKLNSNGDMQWMKIAGSPGDEHGGELALNTNHLFWFFATHSSVCYFDGDSVCSPAINYISVYCMLDRNGNYIWEKFGGVTKGLGSMSINDIACDEQSNLYLIGDFSSEQIAIDTKYINSTDWELGAVFVAKADKAGVLKWRRKGGFFGSCTGRHIKVMDNNTIYAIGSANTKFTFGNDTIFVTMQTNMYMWMIDSVANEKQLLKVITNLPKDVTKSINKDLVFSGSANNTQIILGGLNKYIGGMPNSYIYRLAHGWPLSTENMSSINQDEPEVYPNPSSQHVNVALPKYNGYTRVFVYDMQGRQVYGVSTQKQQAHFPVNSWPRGTYIVKVTQGQKVMSKLLNVE